METVPSFERRGTASKRHRDISLTILNLRDALSRLSGGDRVPEDAVRNAAADVARTASARAEKGAKNAERAVRSTLKHLLSKLRDVPEVSEDSGYDMLLEMAQPAESDTVRKATYGRDLPPLRT